MSDSAILVPQFIERDAAWASLDATWSLLMAPDWACYIAGTLRRQVLTPLILAWPGCLTAGLQLHRSPLAGA